MMLVDANPGGDVLLRDRTVLVTGVLTPSSIAHTCARIAQEQGAEQTDYHIVYFTTYLQLIDAGKASNHLVISTRPVD